MGKQSPTALFGQKPEKLARLLTTCAGGGMSKGKKSTAKQKSDLLRDLLEDVLPSDQAAIDAFPALLRHLYRELLPLADKSLGELLLSRETALSSVEKIKEYGKKVSASAGSEAEYEASAAIYYAAIASALVFHDQKITHYSYQELVSYFSSLTDKKWIPAKIKRLFKKAFEICKHKAA